LSGKAGWPRPLGSGTATLQLYGAVTKMYVVHMKRVTASEARKHWFRLLDEVATGEVVVLERKGKRLVLRREDSGRARVGGKPSAYRLLLHVPDAAQADRWTWEWKADGKGLNPVARKAR
jgi:hypothetical protein